MIVYRLESLIIALIKFYKASLQIEIIVWLGPCLWFPSDYKKAIKNLQVEGWFKKILESFAATDGSKVHQSFKDGYMKYYSIYCQVDK